MVRRVLHAAHALRGRKLQRLKQNVDFGVRLDPCAVELVPVLQHVPHEGSADVIPFSHLDINGSNEMLPCAR